ncbi:MAG: hypothetical protein HZB25_00535 [Candidatus Eisenbacteria bacterium]|nr:hypothetical protein [Candidatus Eisenbacteria bacterium]
MLHGRKEPGLRRWIPLIILLGLLGWANPSSAMEVQAYAGRSSVAQGEAVTFHVSTGLPRYDLRIYRFGAQIEVVDMIRDLPGQQYPTPPDAYANGCGWPVAFTYTIPENWRSGVYAASFSKGMDYTYCLFVVRPRVPGSVSRILYLVPVATYHAYNNWGGKSLYDGNSTDGVRSPRVSLQRPYAFDNGMGGFTGYEQPFTQWMEKNAIVAEYCTSIDLALHPEILDHYQLLVNVGHDEYWSKEMRDAVENFRDSGRNMAMFGANCAYWQIRLEDEGRTIVCYKDANSDPMRNVDSTRTTVRFRDPPLNRPEAALLGVMYAGHSNFIGVPAVVNDSQHWIFDGTPVVAGDSLGTNIVGYEWDDLAPQSPVNTRALIQTAVTSVGSGNSNSVGSYYEATPEYGFPGGRGAKVFAAGTVQWSWGLDDLGYTHVDPNIQRMTLNIFRGMARPEETARPVPVLFRADARSLNLGSKDLLTLVGGCAALGYGAGVSLRDDGAGPDSVAGDGVYSALVSIPQGTRKPMPYGYRLNGVTALVPGSRGLVWVDDSPESDIQVLPPDRVATPLLVDSPALVRPRVALRILPSAPNPFRASTRISFVVPGHEVPNSEEEEEEGETGGINPGAPGAGQRVRLEVLDVTGRRVRTLVDGYLLPGPGHVTWDGRDANGSQVGSGMYFCRFRAGSESAAVKILRFQ